MTAVIVCMLTNEIHPSSGKKGPWKFFPSKFLRKKEPQLFFHMDHPLPVNLQ